MSTRATYRVSQKNRPAFTVYIHHDGYPEGAAQYFKAALDLPKDKYFAHTGFVERMIRAIPGAEMTSRHSDHGDTDYQYDIREGTNGKPTTVTCKKRGEGHAYKVIWKGSMADFITKYLPAEKPQADNTDQGNDNTVTFLVQQVCGAESASV